ncbi:hypothetical protein CSUB01_06764 [Colletotrichum sublineola]|uniref:Uncharacterized protein n=1 Tax=Colletotrichum sublineola TaxID=1173701 RepID=A0A066XF50_COLSU|nr:hypothetical protein CSUB01_06764 [Colletotrichum sublineola]
MSGAYDPVQQAFESAMQDFKSNLKNEELYRQILGTTSIDQVYDATDELQKEQARTGHLRNLSKIELYLSRLREYAGVVEVFVQVKPDMLALIWGPIKLVLLWANVLKQSFDAIVGALEEIGTLLPEFTDITRIFKDNTRIKEVLILFFKDILDFHLITVKFFGLSRLKFIFEMLWPSRREKIEQVGELIKRHALLMRNEVQFSEIREAHNARYRELEHFEMTKRASIQQEYDRIRSNISPTSYDEDLYRLHGNTCPGTGKWLFRDKTFQGWMQPSHSASNVMWLKGIPGSVIHSLIFQLADGSRTLQAALCQSNGHDIKSSLDGALELLQSLLNCAGLAYIVVDGIDEMEEIERARLLKQLLRLSIHCEDCRFLLSSRPESDITAILQDNTANIEVHHRNSGSVQAYVNHRMGDWFQERSFTSEFQAEIEGLLARLAHTAKDTDGDVRFVSVLDVVRLCGPIVEVVDDYVHLVHFTAKEFFVPQRAMNAIVYVQPYINTTGRGLSSAASCAAIHIVMALRQGPLETLTKHITSNHGSATCLGSNHQPDEHTNSAALGDPDEDEIQPLLFDLVPANNVEAVRALLPRFKKLPRTVKRELITQIAKSGSPSMLTLIMANPWSHRSNDVIFNASLCIAAIEGGNVDMSRWLAAKAQIHASSQDRKDWFLIDRYIGIVIAVMSSESKDIEDLTNGLVTVASTTCSITLARALLEAGAQVNWRLNDNYVTPLQCAARKTTEEAARLMELLLYHGADPTISFKRRKLEGEEGVLQISRWLGISWGELVEKTRSNRETTQN